jgi:phosphopantothenoylcysteine decarboxylase/phosphopantothenate--cysteine ligase
MKVIIGICGSIAAYKSLELISWLKKNADEVKVILTKSALNFITPLTCQTLSKNDIYIDQFVLTKGIKHLSLSEWADLLVIAPATANIIGKAASGIGDDLLSTTILSFQRPMLFVPAMDSGMWRNKIVQNNVNKLKKLGYHFLEPAHGALASGKIGRGRFPEVTLVFKKIRSIIEGYRLLGGRKFLISGGRTEEDMDTVRVITNRSSGKMALELMYAIACRNGNARGVFGETAIDLPADMEIFRARTSREMLSQLNKHINWCDCLIMAAAVGDYVPRVKSSRKMHRQRLSIELFKNKDLVKILSKNKKPKLVVGFSLEDRIDVKRGKEKLAAKSLDLVVLNSASAVAADDAEVKILKKKGRVIKLGHLDKWKLANRIIDECIEEINKKSSTRK